MATARYPGASWAPMTSPSITDFEEMAATAYARLPQEFLSLTGNVLIEIEDFPDEEIVEEMQLESEFDLLGLFRGIGLTETAAVPESGQLPNHITLYRRPILDYWCEHEDTLGDILSHVLIHEIGHHFGLSDDDMEKIEASVL
jgi:predicted Zn-dependent protease with MMP-like domain